MMPETASGDGESCPGAFRLKKSSMKNNKGTCWKIPGLIGAYGKNPVHPEQDKMVTWTAGVPWALQDNGTGPGEKNLTFFRYF